MSLVLLFQQNHQRQQRAAGPFRLGLLLDYAPAPPVIAPSIHIDAPLGPQNVGGTASFGQGSQTFYGTDFETFVGTGVFKQGSQTFYATDREIFAAIAAFKQGSQTFAGVLVSGPASTSKAQSTKFMKNMGTMMNRRGG